VAARSNRASPRPAEREVHIRVVHGEADQETVFDFRACETSARNLLRDWRHRHNPRVSVSVVHDGLLGFLCLPREALWLSHLPEFSMPSTHVAAAADS